MLIKEVVQNYGGRVRFISQDWGSSELAARYGIKKYPVVFVDEVLIAQPSDFGGWGDKGGKYAPWRDPGNHEKFKKDLSRMIDLTLRGDKELAAREGAEADSAAEIGSLPALAFQDLEGRKIDPASLSGQVVVVEFWATWCIPCRSTLAWLGTVERRYGDKITVLAVAVDSSEGDVKKLIRPLALPVHFVMGEKETVAPFGDFSTVPTLFVFDREGKTASVFYGAPRDLHEKVGRLIDSLTRNKQGPGRRKADRGSRGDLRKAPLIRT